MKIEVKCSICSTLLRVDDSHLGKQVRCPNCNGLTQIAEATAPDEEDRRDHDGFKVAEVSKPVKPGQTFQQDFLSLTLGILGLLLVFSCGVLSPVAVAANLYGLYLALFTKSFLRLPNIVTNSVGLALGIIVLLFRFL